VVRTTYETYNNLQHTKNTIGHTIFSKTFFQKMRFRNPAERPENENRPGQITQGSQERKAVRPDL